MGYWASIFFIVPFRNLEIFWVLVPIWINLIFTDFYQEKKGTSLGNAVTNAAVMLWVGVDWIRFLIRNFESFSGAFLFKVILCSVVIIFGIILIIEGIQAKKIISHIARVRETSYVLLVVSPVIYGVLAPSFRYVIAIIIFAPLFYWIFELIDRALPTPKTYEESGKPSEPDF